MALILVNYKSSESLFWQNQPLCLWKWTQMPKAVAVDSFTCFAISHLLIRNQNKASSIGAESVAKDRVVVLLFQTWYTGQVSLKLPLLEIPERSTTRAKLCRCSEYALWMTYSMSLWDILLEHGKPTTCESGLEHCVGVQAVLFLSRAVDSRATEMEDCKQTFKKKAQVVPVLVMCASCGVK